MKADVMARRDGMARRRRRMFGVMFVFGDRGRRRRRRSVVSACHVFLPAASLRRGAQ